MSVVLPLAVGLYAIPSGDLALLVVAAVGLSLGIAALSGRTVQAKLGIARTPAVKFRKVHDALVDIWDPLYEFRYKHGPECPRSVWEPKVTAWEASLWQMVDDVFYGRGRELRSDMYKISELTSTNYSDDGRWAWAALRLLDQRREMLDKLAKDIPPA
jgi:hypothetical protein